MSFRELARLMTGALLALAVFVAAGADAMAGPQGQEEVDVCEGEQRRAGQACTAYCERLDCDSDPDAPAKKCFKLAERYQRLTGELLPCECPCGFELSQLVQSRFWDEDTVSCSEGAQDITLTDEVSIVQTVPGYMGDPALFSCQGSLFDKELLIVIDIFPNAASASQIDACNRRIREAAAILVPSARNDCTLP